MLRLRRSQGPAKLAPVKLHFRQRQRRSPALARQLLHMQRMGHATFLWRRPILPLGMAMTHLKFVA